MGRTDAPGFDRAPRRVDGGWRLLIVCLARPEFLDQRPGWPGERVELEPLPEEEAEPIVRPSPPNLDSAARTRAAEAAEGNPLFLEQLLALAAEDGHELVPRTIQALLAARLDRLEPDERALLDAAAVVGKEFWRGALLDLSPPGTEVSALLQRLVRKRLIARERQPSAAKMLSASATSSSATPPTARSPRKLGLSYMKVRRLARASQSPYDEIVGYHLEQAYRLRAELGRLDEAGGALATRAAKCLATAGRRARVRGDASAAINLFERASELYPSDDVYRYEFAAEFGHVLFDAGRLVDAETLLMRASEDTRRLQREDLGLLADIQLASLRMQTDPGTPVEETLALAWRAVDVFEAAGDERGLAHAWDLIQQAENLRGHLSQVAPPCGAGTGEGRAQRRPPGSGVRTRIDREQPVLGLDAA